MKRKYPPDRKKFPLECPICKLPAKAVDIKKGDRALGNCINGHWFNMEEGQPIPSVVIDWSNHPEVIKIQKKLDAEIAAELEKRKNSNLPLPEPEKKVISQEIFILEPEPEPAYFHFFEADSQGFNLCFKNMSKLLKSNWRKAVLPKIRKLIAFQPLPKDIKKIVSVKIGAVN